MPIIWPIESVGKRALVRIGDTKGSWPLGKALRVVVKGISKMNIETAVHLELLDLATIHDDVMLKIVLDNPIQNKISVESLPKINFHTWQILEKYCDNYPQVMSDDIMILVLFLKEKVAQVVSNITA